MRMRIILQIASLLVLLLGTSVNGLFFHYPKNVLLDFFKSLHNKKEVKPQQNIHHYHVHYYPVHTQYLAKPIKAPLKFDFDKLHSNHLESLGWGDNEYKYVPEPEIYRSSPLDDIWPDSSLARSLLWDDEPPNQGRKMAEKKAEVGSAGIIVQVPLHQNIVVQQAPKEEKAETNPLMSFFQGIKRIKNSLFSNVDGAKVEKDRSDDDAMITEKSKTYLLYMHPEYGRKM